jgi:hypothetical protein
MRAGEGSARHQRMHAVAFEAPRGRSSQAMRASSRGRRLGVPGDEAARRSCAAPYSSGASRKWMTKPCALSSTSRTGGGGRPAHRPSARQIAAARGRNPAGAGGAKVSRGEARRHGPPPSGSATGRKSGRAPRGHARQPRRAPSPSSAVPQVRSCGRHHHGVGARVRSPPASRRHRGKAPHSAMDPRPGTLQAAAAEVMKSLACGR